MSDSAGTELFDREAELEQIAAALDSACAGNGRALIVEGVAGIGKTSLLTYARRSGARAGMTVLEARAAQFEEGYAWGIVRQLFDRVLRSQLDQDGELLSGAAELSIPAFGIRAELAGGSEDAFAVLHGLYWLTANLAARFPLLVAVDDLHWSDRPSLRFIAHLARRLEGLPVLLMATTTPPRSNANDEDALLPAILGDQGVLVLRPAALGPEPCAAIVRASLAAGTSVRFEQACREVTGGNPFLLHALLDNLRTEGVLGKDEDVGHFGRMTPRAVSQSVLLRLAHMSSDTLAVARGVAVLGSGATASRIAALAELDAARTGDAIEALKAEGMLEGDSNLGFVHPLVRSAVYDDQPRSTRQRWHERVALSLSTEGAKADELAVHLLASGTRGDPWLVDTLREAAMQARREGAPELARSYLERALIEPPADGVRCEVLVELGSLEVDQMPAAAVEHLTEALELTVGHLHRGEVQLELSMALALSGRFVDAVKLLEASIAELDDVRSDRGIMLRSALLTAARWDLTTRPLTRPLIAELSREVGANEAADPRLHANLAIEFCAEGRELDRALGHVREALKAVPELMLTHSPTLPEVISVLVFADRYDEARKAVEAWLVPAQRRGWLHSSAVAASVASLVAYRRGAISDAVAWAHQALDAGAETWLMPIATGFLVLALIERGDLEQAEAELELRGLGDALPPTWPYNVARHARGCLFAATGAHESAWVDLMMAGELAERWGMFNPAMMRWRSVAGHSIALVGREREARVLCAEELQAARRWGAPVAVGVALRGVGVVEGGVRGVDFLIEAVRVLQHAPARIELARAQVDLGVALRHRGNRIEAREHLRAGLAIAYEQGGLGLVERAREELVIAGGRPRRPALRGRDALTPSELRCSQMARQGQTNRQIAQALFVGQRTVEIHLTNAYAKLGISSRGDLASALESSESVDFAEPSVKGGAELR
jgi:DNA-binding CsgD family transcriptional regulator